MPIDPDGLAGHNRPRLSGSLPSQIDKPKVEALAEILRPTRTDGEIAPVAAPFADRRARELAATADVIVVATDNLASRLGADRFARRVGVPLVDAGINVQLEDGRIRRVGGRANVFWPLGPCLTCIGVLTPDAVAAEVDPLGYRAQGRAEEAAVSLKAVSRNRTRVRTDRPNDELTAPAIERAFGLELCPFTVY